MSDVVNDLLTQGLTQRLEKTEPLFKLPAFHMGKARVNFSDRDALESAME